MNSEPRFPKLGISDWCRGCSFWIVALLVLLVLLSALSIQDWGRRDPVKAFRVQAVHNARLIGLAMFEFEQEYGCYPDAAAIAKIREKHATDLNLGTKSSNDFFRQLLASGIATNESMFYANVSGVHKPDNVFTGTKALEKGECGFAYFTGASSSSKTKRPVAATPMIPGTERFDPKPFDGRAVVLWSDNSVSSIAVRKDGCAFLGTSNLMDPSNPIWGGKKPVIAWPDL